MTYAELAVPGPTFLDRCGIGIGHMVMRADHPATRQHETVQSAFACDSYRYSHDDDFVLSRGSGQRPRLVR